MLRSSLIPAFVCAFALLATSLSAQQFENLNFSTKEDYKTHEPTVLSMANFVLSVPAGSQEARLPNANIIKWMSGTPDYQFVVDNSVMDLTKKNDEVLMIYMASATKAALDGPSTDANSIKLRAFELLLDYCAKAENGIKTTKELKKAFEARANNSLKEYLKM